MFPSIERVGSDSNTPASKAHDTTLPMVNAMANVRQDSNESMSTKKKMDETRGRESERDP